MLYNAQRCVTSQVFLTSCRGWTGRSAPWTRAPETLSTPAAPGRWEQRHQNNLGPPLFVSFTFQVKLTPDASPTQARDSELMVFTLKINWKKGQKQKGAETSFTCFISFPYVEMRTTFLPQALPDTWLHVRGSILVSFWRYLIWFFFLIFFFYIIQWVITLHYHYKITQLHYHSAAWGRGDSMNCPNCPECVTYIPAYTTKLRPVNKTISEGQTTQRNSHSVNECRILINHRYT